MTQAPYQQHFLHSTRHHALSTRLLDDEFNRVQPKFKPNIEKADCTTAFSNWWQNVRGQGINYYIMAGFQWCSP
uniref:Uncharacterized protein n=1 Tax=Anguilla anguilla TaxID=7936 RepID=A0A0E9WC11_ANGAN